MTDLPKKLEKQWKQKADSSGTTKAVRLPKRKDRKPKKSRRGLRWPDINRRET